MKVTMPSYKTVSGERFLHINRSPEEELPRCGKGQWIPGKSYTFGGQKNPRMRLYDNMSWGVQFPDGQGGEKFCFTDQLVLEMLKYLKTGIKHPNLAQVFHYDLEKTLKKAHETMYHLNSILREYIFEEVRRERFPNYPSRSNCLYLFNDGKPDLAYWIQGLMIQNFPPVLSAELVVFSLRGKIFATNRITGVFLPLVTASPVWWRAKALEYWGGSVEDSPDAEEILFEGEATVESVIPIERGGDVILLPETKNAVHAASLAEGWIADGVRLSTL